MTRIYMHHRQRHLQLRTDSAAMGFKSIRRSLQAVVHMDGIDLPGPALRTCMQQCRGVCTAAVGHSHRQGGRKSLHGLIDRKRHPDLFLKIHSL